MAETQLKKYSVQEKLNKMDVDLIDVTVAADVDDQGSSAAGDLLFKVTEVPNAVAVKGGSAILQSVVMLVDDNDVGTVDLVVTSSSTDITDSSGVMATGDALSSDGDNTLAELQGTCGIVSITNAKDLGVVMVGSKGNIGMVCKAASDSTSLYIWGMQQSAADYDESSIVFRLGFIKD